MSNKSVMPVHTSHPIVIGLYDWWAWYRLPRVFMLTISNIFLLELVCRLRNVWKAVSNEYYFLILCTIFLMIPIQTMSETDSFARISCTMPLLWNLKSASCWNHLYAQVSGCMWVILFVHIPGRMHLPAKILIKFYGRSVVRQYIKAKPTKYGVKLWAICCGCCGYSFTQDMYLGGTAGHVGGRDVVLQLSEPFLDKGHVIYCDRLFSHLDLAAYLRSRKTGMVGTTSATSLPRDIDYLVKHMHPLTWAYKWFQHDADFKFHNKGIVQDMRAKESVSLIVWMDKKYRTEDKKVVFITNCLPNIPQSADQFQEKNIRDGQHKYSRQPVPSPPIVKAYNNRMGGVDRHDRLVGHHSIPLSSKRGYVKVFFHLLDSAVVNSWILFKTAQKSKGKWSLAEERRYTLAWFKESVILSLCGTFTSRKQTPSLNLSKPVLPTLTIRQATLHQIKPVSQISGMVSTPSKCIGCGCLKRTACAICKLPYCYDCGVEHLNDILIRASEDTQHLEEDDVNLSDQFSP